jgi:hypothetical protein
VLLPSNQAERCRPNDGMFNDFRYTQLIGRS